MTQTLIFVVLFVVVLALIPAGLKWVQNRSVAGGFGATSASRVISAVAVGPHQRVVTVEVGTSGARVWLTLGVTSQAIVLLHSAAVESNAELVSPAAVDHPPVLS